MRASPAVTTLLAVAAIASFTTFVGAQSPPGWPIHNDVKGFSISTPPGWNFGSDASTGRIVVHGPIGEQIVVWPASIGQPLDAEGATGLVQQMARQVDAQMPWRSCPSDCWRGAHRRQRPTAQWRGHDDLVKKRRRHLRPVLLRRSPCKFLSRRSRYVRHNPGKFPRHTSAQHAGRASSSGAKAAGQITFTTWNEPRENAYSISIPQGWQAVGGLYHLSATDVRSDVVVGSRDGQIRVRFGDSNLGTFIQPNQMMAYARLREGMYYRLGDGSQLLIERYLTGQQAAQVYAQTYVAKQCSGLQLASNGTRPDIAQIFGPKFAPKVHLMRSSRPARSPSLARWAKPQCGANSSWSTVLPVPGPSGIWYVYRLYGYLAAPGREQDAERVVERVVQSFRINPQWQAQQQQIANSAVAADNARSATDSAAGYASDSERSTGDLRHHYEGLGTAQSGLRRNFPSPRKRRSLAHSTSLTPKPGVPTRSRTIRTSTG